MMTVTAYPSSTRAGFSWVCCPFCNRSHSHHGSRGERQAPCGGRYVLTPGSALTRTGS
jgi:hypothetical protein